MTGAHRVASVTHVLRKADLALLAVDNVPASTTELAIGTPTYNAQDQLMALGYPLQAPEVGSAKLTYRFGAHTLRGILSTTLQNQVRSAGVPDLDLPLVSLDGHLLPGLSGAPILDARGDVVAIGDGGVDEGAASISFAIPSDHIQALAASSEALNAPETTRLTVLFAADFDSKVGTSTQCGQTSFIRVRQRSLADMAQTTDDPFGLQQLLTVFHIAPQQDIRFDVYQDTASTATFVLPAGAQLRYANGFCSAQLTPDIEIRPAHADRRAMVHRSHGYVPCSRSATGWFDCDEKGLVSGQSNHRHIAP